MPKWLKSVAFYSKEKIRIETLVFIIKVTGSGYNDEGDVLCGHERVTYDSHPSISKVVEVGAVCNNAEIINNQLRGQPTEGALLSVAMKVNDWLVNISLTKEKKKQMISISR